MVSLFAVFNLLELWCTQSHSTLRVASVYPNFLGASHNTASRATVPRLGGGCEFGGLLIDLQVVKTALPRAFTYALLGEPLVVNSNLTVFSSCGSLVPVGNRK